MILYHMSDTLKLGDEMALDFKKTMSLAQPFVQALEQSEDCFYAMVLNAKYLRAVLGKFKLWEMVGGRCLSGSRKCSVVKCFSTFACCNTGIFEDFYIEPVFRGKGIARMLARAAQNWSKENGLASLSVTCAPCDEGMYQALGFDAGLGTTFAHII